MFVDFKFSILKVKVSVYVNPIENLVFSSMFLILTQLNLVKGPGTNIKLNPNVMLCSTIVPKSRLGRQTLSSSMPSILPASIIPK